MLGLTRIAVMDHRVKDDEQCRIEATISIYSSFGLSIRGLPAVPLLLRITIAFTSIGVSI
jgi:hypothetical protein